MAPDWLPPRTGAASCDPAYGRWSCNLNDQLFVSQGLAALSCGLISDGAWPCRAGRRQVTVCSTASQLAGWGLFFSPGLLAVAYSFWRGKGNAKDGFSRLLTEVSQGYLQPDVGGEAIPVAQGELSDLVGGEPLFKPLYQW